MSVNVAPLWRLHNVVYGEHPVDVQKLYDCGTATVTSNMSSNTEELLKGLDMCRLLISYIQ